jgi:hypothetical protein
MAQSTVVLTYVTHNIDDYYMTLSTVSKTCQAKIVAAYFGYIPGIFLDIMNGLYSVLKTTVNFLFPLFIYVLI